MGRQIQALVLSIGVIGPPLAHAQEAGTIRVRIDGETHGMGLSASQSDWSGWGNGGSVSISAEPDNYNADGARMTLAVGFEFFGMTGSSLELRLRQTANDSTILLFGDAKTGATVTLDTVSVEGDLLSVMGSFERVKNTSGAELEGQFLGQVRSEDMERI